MNQKTRQTRLEEIAGQLEKHIPSDESVCSSVKQTVSQSNQNPQILHALPSIEVFATPPPPASNTNQTALNGSLTNETDSHKGVIPQQLQSNSAPTSAEIGITCSPMTEVDRTFFSLVSGLHSTVALAKEPFLFNRNENYFMPSENAQSVEDGFAMLDYFAQKMVGLVLLMPHFSEIDHAIISELIEDRMIGATLIFSCLYYQLSNLSWVFNLTLSNGLEKEITMDCLRFFLSTFKPLAFIRNHLNLPAMEVQDIGAVTMSILNCFKRICTLSNDDGVFKLALLAYCLCMDDGSNAERQHALSKVLPIYERFLMQLSHRTCGNFDFCEFYREVVKISQSIRWIEARYCEIAKFVDRTYLPPLMRETIANINRPYVNTTDNTTVDKHVRGQGQKT